MAHPLLSTEYIRFVTALLGTHWPKRTMDGPFSDKNEPLNSANVEVESRSGCRLCGLLTIHKCERCGDNYCSDKCYKNDWPNHRYICFPKPALVRINQCLIEDVVYPAKCSVNTTKNDDEDIKHLRQMMEHYDKDVKSLHDMMELMIKKLDRIEDYQKRNLNSSTEIVVSNGFGGKTNFCNGIQDTESSSNDLSESITNDSRKSQSRKRIKIEDNDQVVLCAFRSTNRCAIRSKNAEIEAAYRKVVEEIDEYGRDAPQLKSIPELGAYAIAMKTNKQFTRVKVTKVFNEDRIRVMFCDYGNSVCRKLSDLREISKEIIDLPEYVSTIQLHGVNMSKYSTKIIEFFKSFERKVYRIKFKSENGGTFAELYDIENDHLLNESLAKFFPENDDTPKTTNSSIVPKEPSKISNESTKKSEILDLNSDSENEYENEAVMTALFETCIFKVDTTNIKAVVLDTTLIEHGYVSCTDRNNLAYLSRVQNILANMDYEDDFYEPKLNEYCVALYENEWYRGNVSKILDGGKRFEISFIDFLNISIVTSTDIRPYPKELTINCYTTLCQIDGLPKKITQKQREFLKKNVKINDIINIARVLEILDGKIALIECSEIILSMHAQNVM